VSAAIEGDTHSRREVQVQLREFCIQLGSSEVLCGVIEHLLTDVAECKDKCVLGCQPWGQARASWWCHQDWPPLLQDTRATCVKCPARVEVSRETQGAPILSLVQRGQFGGGVGGGESPTRE